jgi:hypothetical protein
MNYTHVIYYHMSSLTIVSRHQGMNDTNRCSKCHACPWHEKSDLAKKEEKCVKILRRKQKGQQILLNVCH